MRWEGQQKLRCVCAPPKGEKVVGGRRVTSTKLYSAVDSAKDGGESP